MRFRPAVPFTFPSESDLLRQLSNTSIAVPHRHDGRTTEHTELWSICRLLSTLGGSELGFPLTVTKREKPDFELVRPNRRIGVEISEVVHEDYARLVGSRVYAGAPRPIQMDQFRPQLRYRSARPEKLLKIGTSTSGNGWIADEPEQEWCASMIERYKDKLANLNSEGFATYEENWLLLYDNVRTADLDLEHAAGYLVSSVAGVVPQNHRFHRILIESGPRFLILSFLNSPPSISFLQIADVWGGMK